MNNGCKQKKGLHTQSRSSSWMGGKESKCAGLLNTPNYHHYHNSASFRKVKWSLMCSYVSIIDHFARICYTALWLPSRVRAAAIVRFVQLSRLFFVLFFLAWGAVERSSSRSQWTCVPDGSRIILELCFLFYINQSWSFHLTLQNTYVFFFLFKST